ncbi:PEX4 [Acrasis kona]|uniref:E2 ubiquitin-conjugating enzyme n=1 Tax=Acrasis kona TaxID=1008807 RepID=A0AAW2ZK85_9EUKA
MAQRLLREYKEIQKQRLNSKEVQDLWLVPEESNIHNWHAKFIGPADTPYEGGVFEIRLTVPQQYPIMPPKAVFLTNVFHPNVHFKTGEICLDILKNAWSPAWTIATVCRAIISLLSHPEHDSPLNCDAGNLLRCGDERGFKSMARMYTKIHALETNLRKNYQTTEEKKEQ